MRNPDGDPQCPLGKKYFDCPQSISGTTTFHGCCSINACHTDGWCPDEDTSPLPRDIISTTPQSLSQAPAESVDQPPPSPSPLSNPVVKIGVAVGVVLVILAAGALWYLIRRRRSANAASPAIANPQQRPPFEDELKLVPSTVATRPAAPIGEYDTKGLHNPPMKQGENSTFSMYQGSREMAAEMATLPPLPINPCAELPAARVDPVELPGDHDFPAPSSCSYPNRMGARSQEEEDMEGTGTSSYANAFHNPDLSAASSTSLAVSSRQFA